MITIVDYGLGNLGSIKNMLKKIGFDSLITSDLKKIEKANKLILPGVGAFDNGMENLKKFKLIPVLNKAVLENKIPILGICLGMQLMTGQSEEGKLAGLGWIEGETTKFNFPNGNLKVPHMGWNKVKMAKKSPLTDSLKGENRFYFVHSYYVTCKNSSDVLMQTNYGFPFCSAFSSKNIYGVQFHPEKSHQYGMRLLENFALKI